MKKLAKLVILTAMVFFVYSCGNNGGQKEHTNDNASEQSYFDETDAEEENEPEKYFSYQILRTGNDFFFGVAILYGDDNTMDYLKFDDEEDYYDGFIFEWALGLSIAHDLCWNSSLVGKNENEYLKCVHCLPSCLDNYGIVDEGVRKIFLKKYYDLKDAAIYEPKRGYGYRKYPVEKAKYSYGEYVLLYRIDADEDIPSGTLGLRFTSL